MPLLEINLTIQLAMESSPPSRMRGVTGAMLKGRDLESALAARQAMLSRTHLSGLSLVERVMVHPTVLRTGMMRIVATAIHFSRPRRRELGFR